MRKGLKKVCEVVIAVAVVLFAALGNETLSYAFPTYEEQTYYSDVVETKVTLASVKADEDISANDAYKILDHKECWGTRDCTILTLPEDGCVKFYLKNTLANPPYGSTMLLFSNKDLTKKLEADISVDGGGSGSSAIYLEKGTYYLFTTSANYDGNEFIKGNDILKRRTEIWAGYVPQEDVFSVKSVALSEDKKSAKIEFNLPESYSTLRVEDYFIGYEDLKNSTKWETATRTNTIEDNTYTATKNGVYSFRLSLKEEQQEQLGFAYICHVRVSGIKGEEYEVCEKRIDNLPVINETKETIPAVRTFKELDDEVDAGLKPVYERYARKYTSEKFSITLNEAGTIFFKGYTQANLWMYSEAKVTIYVDKNYSVIQNSFTIDGAASASFSLLPGTYYITVETANNSVELDDMDYVERHVTLYAGFYAAKQAVTEEITYSKDRNTANVLFHIRDDFEVTDIWVWDYEMNKVMINDKFTGDKLTLEDNRLEAKRNGIYTVYIKGTGKNAPMYIFYTFKVDRIGGETYKKEVKAAPSDEIPYIASFSDLLTNIKNGQRPIMTHTQYQPYTSDVKKIVLEKDTLLYAYVNDICDMGCYYTTISYYKDFQCTNLFASKTIDSCSRGYAVKYFPAGTYYMQMQCTSNMDGLDVYRKVDWYLGGMYKEDIVSKKEISYDTANTKATITVKLNEDEQIGEIKCYKGTLASGSSICVDSNCVATVNGKNTIEITENGDYVIVIVPKNICNLYKSIGFDVKITDIKEKAAATPMITATPNVSTTPQVSVAPEASSTPQTDTVPKESVIPKESTVPQESKEPEAGSTPKSSTTPEITGTPKPSATPEKTKAPENTSGSATNETGKSFWKGKICYKITNQNGKKTVVVTKVKDTIGKTLTIPATVSYNKTTYSVTKISANACKNITKLTKVNIGKEITEIGKKAFYGCKNLKTIVLKSDKLKTVGANALKGISKKATIKVSKKKWKAYSTKILKGKGQAKTVKIKKQ